jgi:hypothetical protein
VTALRGSAVLGSGTWGCASRRSRLEQAGLAALGTGRNGRDRFLIRQAGRLSEALYLAGDGTNGAYGTNGTYGGRAAFWRESRTQEASVPSHKKVVLTQRFCDPCRGRVAFVSYPGVSLRSTPGYRSMNPPGSFFDKSLTQEARARFLAHLSRDGDRKSRCSLSIRGKPADRGGVGEWLEGGEVSGFAGPACQRCG